MEVLYIPQLDEVDASGDTTATRYKLLTKRPESGVVGLEDKAVNKIAITTEDALRLVMPPLVKGQVRDFFVRLVITSDAIPEVTFAAPTGEIISFEDIDEDVLKCEIGINVFSFTENDEGVFFVNRKVMDIDHTVELDACGGSGVYFMDGSTTYTQTFEASQSVNPVSEAVTKPETPKAPKLKLGVVAQRYPWDGKIDVQYWAQNTPNEGYEITITVTLPDGTTASETYDCKNGKNTVAFDARAKFGEVQFPKGVKVKATLSERK